MIFLKKYGLIIILLLCVSYLTITYTTGTYQRNEELFVLDFGQYVIINGYENGYIITKQGKYQITDDLLMTENSDRHGLELLNFLQKNKTYCATIRNLGFIEQISQIIRYGFDHTYLGEIIILMTKKSPDTNCF